MPPSEYLKLWYTGEGVEPLLARLPTLRDLTLSFIWMYSDDCHSPRPFSFSLTSLAYDSYSLRVFHALTANSLSTLRTLRIKSYLLIHDDVRKALPSFVALRELSVTLEIIDFEHSRLTASAIMLAPRLQTLTVSCTSIDTYPLPTELLPRLPPSLQIFDLRFIQTHPSARPLPRRYTSPKPQADPP